MLSAVLAHERQPLAPHDLAGAWNADPWILLGLFLTAWAYLRGRPATERVRTHSWRRWCFGAGMVTVGLALVSPLDAMAGALASAHMVQHVLLLLVAAPLLAVSAPMNRIVRGSPPTLRSASVRWRRRLNSARAVRALRRPNAVWMAHVAVIWTWHASVPYGAALRHDALHALEHAAFFTTGLLFWSMVVGARRAHRVSPGYAVLLIFAMAMQSVFLSALLTFARTPWYSAYASTTGTWGLDPLADQQLAGVIMWVPAGAVYLIAALTLVAAWIRESDPHVALLSRL